METKPDVRVPAGKLFCFSEGAYSDYGYIGHFLALVDITNATLQEAADRARERAKVEPCHFGGEVPTEDYEINYATKALFIPELVRMGVVLDIDCAEIHIGSYGQLDWS